MERGFVGIIIPKSEINLFSRFSFYFSARSKFVNASNYMSSGHQLWLFRFKEEQSFLSSFHSIFFLPSQFSLDLEPLDIIDYFLVY